MAKKNGKTNCWEFKKCGMEKTRGCPAYPAGGSICYMLAGTMCKGTPHGAYKEKSKDCVNCDFYTEVILEHIPPGIA